MKQIFKNLYWAIVRALPGLRPVYDTRTTQTPVSLRSMLAYRLKRRGVYWPVHSSSVIVDAQRILIGIETSPGLMPGCYVQGSNGVVVGDYTQVAAGVAIISANHALTDNRAHVHSPPVRIGPYCWLGAHCVILPGVTLGEYTIVGAGAIVTKSFDEGYQVIAGNPAKVIKKLDPAECILHRSQKEYHGFIAADDFPEFRKRYLDVN